MENKFCFLKGIVACDSGRIQDCNNRRAKTCPLEAAPATGASKGEAAKKAVSINGQEAFCYLKGLVDCGVGRVQDCNIKRVPICPME